MTIHFQCGGMSWREDMQTGSLAAGMDKSPRNQTEERLDDYWGQYGGFHLMTGESRASFNADEKE